MTNIHFLRSITKCHSERSEESFEERRYMIPLDLSTDGAVFTTDYDVCRTVGT